MATATLSKPPSVAAIVCKDPPEQPFCSLSNMQRIANHIMEQDCSVRVVLNSQLPAELQVPEDSWGLAGETVTLSLRNLWRERKRSADDCEFVIIHASEITAYAREQVRYRDGQTAEDLEQRLLLSVLLHELAHVVERPPVPPFSPSRHHQGSFSRRGLSRLFASDDKRWIFDKDTPMLGHGWRFIRSLVHVVYRFRRLFRLATVQPYNDIALDSFTYRLSDLPLYIDALGDEPYRLRNQAFSVIRNTEAPAKFRELFRSDVKRWLELESETK